jgi:hypothetical protein
MIGKSADRVEEMRMRSNVLRTGTSTLRVLGPLLLSLLVVAAALPASGAAAAKRSGPLVAVKTAKSTRGSVVLHLRAGASLRRDLVRLNGHRVDAFTPHRKGERAVLVLDRADHLRFGRNVITVSARSRAGSKARVRRLVTVRRDAPLPGIRQPRRVVTGHVARLDARRTRAAHGGALHYRWRVVGAPRGAKVVLRGARGLRPQLIANVPGSYRVALTVSEEPGGNHGRPGAARASVADSPCAVPGASPATVEGLPAYGPIASLPISRLPKGALRVVGGSVSPGSEAETEAAPSAEPGCATDVTEVGVEPNFAPIGAAIDTRAEVEETEGIRIAGSFYPFPAGESSDGARFVVLDATNLELIRTENVNLTGSHRAVAAKLVEESAPERDAIVVSSCRVGDCPGDAADSSEGFSAIESFAAGKLTGEVENQGQALAPKAEGNLRGGLEGWLHRGLPQAGETPLFSYVAPEEIPFDTEATSAAGSNTISVGGSQYPANLPAGAGAGFEVLVLNPAAEPILGTPTAFGTYSQTNQPAAQAQEEAMTALLRGTDPTDTVLIQSIGDPVPGSNAANPLAAALAAIGADPSAFLGLEGGGGYAFVGNGTPPATGSVPGAATAEADEEEAIAGGGPKGAGSLHGLLSRNEASGLSPTIADATGEPNYEIAQVAYQPSTEWPQTETQGKVEATTFLAEKLNLTGKPNGTGLCYRPARPDFRSSYCNQAMDPLAKAAALKEVGYPSETVEFSETEFAEVKAELVRELGEVEEVRTMFGTLKAPFVGAHPEISAQAIAGDIIEAMPERTRQNGATANTATLFASILDASSLLPGGDLLGVLSAALYISDEFSEEEGEPSPPVWKFQVRADQVGEKVEENLQTTVGHLGALENILVSDPGKLATSAAEAGAGWAVTNEGLLVQSETIELGFKRWMWESILPAGFELFHFPGLAPGTQSVVHCLTKRNYNWAPFEKSANQSVFFPTDRFENGYAESSGGYAMLAGPVSSSSSIPVDSELAEKIFGPPKKKGAGLTETELLRNAHWTTNEPRLIGEGGESENIQPGWCEL